MNSVLFCVIMAAIYTAPNTERTTRNKYSHIFLIAGAFALVYELATCA